MPSPSAPSHPDIPPFPEPSTFSILPDIYLLIARLTIYQQAQQQKSQSDSETQTIQTQPPPAQNLGPPLDIKELPAQVYKIKQRIAKARAAVSALPDVDRSENEQETEVQELQRTIKLLKQRLGKLGAIAAGGNSEEQADTEAKEDVDMEGAEE